MSRGRPMNAVNPRLDAPPPPGPWIDDERCAVCGALYADHRCPDGWTDATQALRVEARGQGDLGGGYRSRGPLLWRLRVAKLADWFRAHVDCAAGWDHCGARPHPLDPAGELARLPPVWPLDPATLAVRGWWIDDAPALEAARVALAHFHGLRLIEADLSHARCRWLPHGGGLRLHVERPDASPRGSWPATLVHLRCVTSLGEPVAQEAA